MASSNNKARALKATESVSGPLMPTRSRAGSSVHFSIRRSSNRIRDTFGWGMAGLFIASGIP